MEYRTFYLFDRVDMPLPDLVDLRPAADASVVVEGERFVPVEAEHRVGIRSEYGYVFEYRGNICDDLDADRPRPFATYSIIECDGRKHFFHIDVFDWSNEFNCWTMRDDWFISRVTIRFGGPDPLPPKETDSGFIDHVISRFGRAFKASIILFPQCHLRKIPKVEFISHNGPGGRPLSWNFSRSSYKFGDFIIDPIAFDLERPDRIALCDRATGQRLWIHGGTRDPYLTIYRYSDDIGEIESIIYSTEDGYDKDERCNTLGHLRPRIVDVNGHATLDQNVDGSRIQSMIRLWSVKRVLRSFIYQYSFSVDVVTPATFSY